MADFKAMTLEEKLEIMLSNISDDYIKIPGTFTHDLIKNYALAATTLEEKIERLWGMFNIYNLSGNDLERYVFQRKGVKRKEANAATGVVTVKGNGTVREGDLFETPGGVRFAATETKVINISGDVKVKAVTSGSIGNVGANSITLIPVTLQGITSVTNQNPTIDGYDIETDTSLRERYLIEVQKPATSGNIYHYMQWAREVPGVGDSKVFPLWNGNNTVQVVVIDDNKAPASEELVKRVQEYIDPKGKSGETWGTGAGQAPIGAYCTITSATAKNINVDVTVVLNSSYELQNVISDVKDKIKQYLKDIAFIKSAVSYSVLGSMILDIEGISEWTELSINGSHSNVSIGEKEVAVMGTVNVNE